MIPLTNEITKEISIISFQTVVDAIDIKSDLHEDTKLFFATLAKESSKNFTIRKHFAYIPKPVFEKLFGIILELYKEYEEKGNTGEIRKKIDVISSILAGIDMDKFELDEPIQESPFELGRLLNDEAGTNINIVINEKNGHKIKDGLCLIYTPHATAAVIINESWDPNIGDDFLDALNELIPEGKWRHDRVDGNAAAHIKAAILGPSETVLVKNGELVLGRWQNIFFVELDGPRERREVIVYVK